MSPWWPSAHKSILFFSLSLGPMMNHSDNANADSTHNDEGYVEQRFEAPDFMVKWTEEQKAGKTIVENRELEGPNYFCVCEEACFVCDAHLLSSFWFPFTNRICIPTSVIDSDFSVPQSCGSTGTYTAS